MNIRWLDGWHFWSTKGSLEKNKNIFPHLEGEHTNQGWRQHRINVQEKNDHTFVSRWRIYLKKTWQNWNLKGSSKFGLKFWKKPKHSLFIWKSWNSNKSRFGYCNEKPFKKTALARSNKNTESEPHPIPLEVLNSARDVWSISILACEREHVSFWFILHGRAAYLSHIYQSIMFHVSPASSPANNRQKLGDSHLQLGHNGSDQLLKTTWPTGSTDFRWSPDLGDGPIPTFP